MQEDYQSALGRLKKIGDDARSLKDCERAKAQILSALGSGPLPYSQIRRATGDNPQTAWALSSLVNAGEVSARRSPLGRLLYAIPARQLSLL